MLLVGVVAFVRPFAAVYVAFAPLLCGSFILSRFDLWPALLATTAVVLLFYDRHNAGWALLGAAVAAKLWPVVLVPLAIVWSVRRGRPWAPLVGAAVLAVIVLPFAVLSPGGFWSSIHGQAAAAAADRVAGRVVAAVARVSARRRLARVAGHRRALGAGDGDRGRAGRGARRAVDRVCPRPGVG